MKLTDEAIVRWLAEHVMGWKFVREDGGCIEFSCPERSKVFYFPTRMANDAVWFNPLVDARATDELLAALRNKGYILMMNMYSKTSVVDFYTEEQRCPPVGSVRSADWKRTVCLAAYWATGGPDED